LIRSFFLLMISNCKPPFPRRLHWVQNSRTERAVSPSPISLSRQNAPGWGSLQRGEKSDTPLFTHLRNPPCSGFTVLSQGISSRTLPADGLRSNKIDRKKFIAGPRSLRTASSISASSSSRLRVIWSVTLSSFIAGDRGDRHTAAGRGLDTVAGARAAP